MKIDTPVIILAGGFGTRLSEETSQYPKPMVRIGADPILHHLIRIYAVQGFTDFYIMTGYKHEIIDEWVDNNNKLNLWGFNANVSTIYSGENTQTGGRIKLCMDLIKSDRYLATYGDGLGNINIKKLIEEHIFSQKIATVTVVRPPARFGYIKFEGNKITSFGEKNQSDEGWINGGFFVLNRETSNYILDELEPFEIGALPRLVNENQLNAHFHTKFWQPMDTLREKKILEELATTGKPPWLQI